MENWTIVSEQNGELAMKRNSFNEKEFLVRKVGKMVSLTFEEIERLYKEAFANMPRMSEADETADALEGRR